MSQYLVLFGLCSLSLLFALLQSGRLWPGLAGRPMPAAPAPSAARAFAPVADLNAWFSAPAGTEAPALRAAPAPARLFTAPPPRLLATPVAAAATADQPPKPQDRKTPDPGAQSAVEQGARHSAPLAAAVAPADSVIPPTLAPDAGRIKDQRSGACAEGTEAQVETASASQHPDGPSALRLPAEEPCRDAGPAAEGQAAEGTDHAPQAEVSPTAEAGSGAAGISFLDYLAEPEQTVEIDGFDPLHDVLLLPEHPMLAEYVPKGYLLVFGDGQTLLLSGLVAGQQPVPLWELQPAEAQAKASALM